MVTWATVGGSVITQKDRIQDPHLTPCWFTSIRGSLPGAGFLLCSTFLLIFPSSTRYQLVSPPTPFKHTAQLGDFKRLTSAWISSRRTGSGVKRVSINRLRLQKWDQWTNRYSMSTFCEHSPGPGCTFAKAASGSQRVAKKGEGRKKKRCKQGEAGLLWRQWTLGADRPCCPLPWKTEEYSGKQVCSQTHTIAKEISVLASA